MTNPNEDEIKDIDTDNIKRMDILEFQELGFLQEVNRLFFHPLGLALEVIWDEDKKRLGGIWDYRDDPEGIVFAQGVIRSDKIKNVLDEQERHREARTKIFGDIIQEV